MMFAESSSVDDERLLDPENKSYGFWKEGSNLVMLSKLLERKFSILQIIPEITSLT